MEWFNLLMLEPTSRTVSTEVQLHKIYKKENQRLLPVLAEPLKEPGKRDTKMTSTDNNRLQNEDKTQFISFSHAVSYSYCKPLYAKIEASTLDSIKNWNQLFFWAMNVLSNKYGQQFIDAYNSCDFSKYALRIPKTLNNGMKVESNLSATALVYRLGKIIDVLKIPDEDGGADKNLDQKSEVNVRVFL